MTFLVIHHIVIVIHVFNIFTKMKLRCASIVFIFLWNGLQPTDGALSDTFKKCCDMGTNWAIEGLSCGSYPSPVPGIDAQEQTICLSAIKMCCRQKHKNDQCSAGEEVAKAGKSCSTTSTKPGSEFFKDCCEACEFGLLSGSTQQCDADAFDTHLKASFLKCCEEKTTTSSTESTTTSKATTQSSSTTETSKATETTPTSSSETPRVTTTVKTSSTTPSSFSTTKKQRNFCHLIGDALCAHRCIPLSGSYKCECRKGYVLMADKKSCRQAPSSTPDRCLVTNPCEQICTDTGVEIICSCDEGFKLLENNRTCEDLNECEEGTDDCDSAFEICINEVGSFRCITKDETKDNSGPDISDSLFDDDLKCPKGYQFNKTEKTCDDINECNSDQDNCNRTAQFCVNTVGSFTCIGRTSKSSCPAGFKVNELGICEDLDECTENKEICSETEICINENGGYRCISRETESSTTKPTSTSITTASTTPFLPPIKCSPGFAYDPLRKVCLDIDECAAEEKACDSTQECINTMGSYRCECRVGFQLDPITGACTDINECQQGTHRCNVGSQRCDNTIGSYQCVRYTSCGTGYTLNAASGLCEDDDECELGIHDCHALGEGFQCRNTLGSFRCEKKITFTTRCYSGNCVATESRFGGIPPVLFRPPTIPKPAQPGVNTVYNDCPTGYYSDGAGDCLDIDECITKKPCQKHQQCINSLGSYRCVDLVVCSRGFKINDNGFCEDIDECATGTHTCTELQNCINREGSYICQCPLGYKLDLQTNTCQDINECAYYRGQTLCGRNAECENTQGSYRCRCKEGFREKNNFCEDINECEESLNLCQHKCVNVWGSYRCVCNSGFTLSADNRTCLDVDECEKFKDKHLCIGLCENTPGSYVCKCPDGYRLGQDKRSCQDIDECERGNICPQSNDVCWNIRGSFRCNTIYCPPNYMQDPEQKNRCKRTIDYCDSRDEECKRKPSTYSHNFITFVSNLPLPQTNRLDLFTMRGPRWDTTSVAFDMELVNARCPLGIKKADKDYFRMSRTNINEAVLSLVKIIQGPQEVELQLTMEVYQNGVFKGSAVAKVFIIVSQYEF